MMDGMISNTLTVAMLQLAPQADPSDSLRVGLEACSAAAAMGADIAVLPEMWNVGYRFPSATLPVEAWRALAISEGDA